ncbi:hypothetical protein E2562_010303 [Oryza meyeriana var. granulata]|uniref:Uncharacterized protein n=1 Tax=Oryza meyeriana var. granulata TaxID=110450 RepID=A0A6G1F612_9ORYZ|nr:hypothetical protein E2562_010303 [Oryza meyeriana var. granulata]
MQRAASGIASLALRRLAAAAAPRPAILAAAAVPRTPAAPSAVARFLLLFQPGAPTPAALYARRGYARKAKAVSEDEEDELEAVGSDGEFDSDFDEEDFDEDDEEAASGSDEDDDCKPAQKRGRR